jgi:hypothetical protein
MLALFTSRYAKANRPAAIVRARDWHAAVVLPAIG